MKWIGTFSLLAVAAATCTTVLFVSALKPTSIGAFVCFSAWLISPYAFMFATLFFLQRKGTASNHWYVVAVIVSIGGILFLTDVIFWHADPQGAIAVLMAPLLQGAALILSIPIAWWIRKNVRT